jgi:hypothetical protein
MDTCGSISPVFRLSSAESDLASEPDDAWDVEKAKDDIRKYHALMELLATEVSYLADLRVLVSVSAPFSPGTCCLTMSTDILAQPLRLVSNIQYIRSQLEEQLLHPSPENLLSLQSRPSPPHNPACKTKGDYATLHRQ